MYKIIDIGWGNSWWIKICNQKIGKIYALLQIYIFFLIMQPIMEVMRKLDLKLLMNVCVFQKKKSIYFSN